MDTFVCKTLAFGVLKYGGSVCRRQLTALRNKLCLLATTVRFVVAYMTRGQDVDACARVVESAGEVEGQIVAEF